MADPSVENFFAQVNGTLDAVVLACVALTATHSEKEKVLALLANLSGSAIASNSDNEQTKSYKTGIRNAVAQITQGVETARLADEVRAIKSNTGAH